MKTLSLILVLTVVVSTPAAAQQTDDGTSDYEEQDRRYYERFVRPGEREESEVPSDPEEQAAAYLARADELIRDPNYRSAASDRYRVQTDDPGTDAKAAVRLLEAFRDFFDAFWKGRTELAPYDEQSRVFLFFSFYRFNELLSGDWRLRETRPAGHYTSQFDVITLHTDPDGRDHLPDSLVHEAAHQLIEQRIYARGHGGSLWIGEGLASYFGYTYMDRDGAFHEGEIGGKADSLARGKSRPSAPQARTVLRTLRKTMKSPRTEDDLRFARVISITDPAVYYGDGALAHYAASWLVVHFLMHGDDGAHRDDFIRYLESEAGGEGGERSFFSLIGMSPRGLEAAVVAHAGNLKVR